MNRRKKGTECNQKCLWERRNKLGQTSDQQQPKKQNNTIQKKKQTHQAPL